MSAIRSKLVLWDQCFVYQDVGIFAQVAIRLSFDYSLDRGARI
jgi:hypothetical protein